MQPELSVVVPTFNRAKVLEENLGALLDQSLDKEIFEIIIVDDGSDDETADVIAKLNRHESHNIRTYWQKNKFAGSARNLGIQKACGPIILFIDDDITPNSDLLKLHFELHRKYPELEVGVLGHVITDNTGVDLLNPDYRKVSYINEKKTGDLFVDPSYLRTSNLSLKRDFIIQAGLFTEGLPCLQDTELGFRLKKRGFRLAFCREAIGIHREPTDTLEKVVKKGKKYGRTVAEWYERIPQLRENLVSSARFNGGWGHFVSDPLKYLKNTIRRWAINQYTIGLILEITKRLSMTNPPKKILVRCCLEIWAYYFRHEFRKRRHQLDKNKISP